MTNRNIQKADLGVSTDFLYETQIKQLIDAGSRIDFTTHNTAYSLYWDKSNGGRYVINQLDLTSEHSQPNISELEVVGTTLSIGNLKVEQIFSFVTVLNPATHTSSVEAITIYNHPTPPPPPPM